jgi:cob(I)alamin adenosyltransferase
VDELNALLGTVRSHGLPEEVDRLLELVQGRLVTIGTELAAPEDAAGDRRPVGEEDVRMLEEGIDSLQESLAPLRRFILPGGSGAGAALHLARAVVRRAERRCVTLSRLEKINPRIISYLNRLSDLCFVMARYVNQRDSAPESFPASEKPRE